MNSLATTPGSQDKAPIFDDDVQGTWVRETGSMPSLDSNVVWGALHVAIEK